MYGELGNGWEACLASILELYIEDIPRKPNGKRAKRTEIQKFLYDRFRLFLNYEKFKEATWAPVLTHYIINGLSDTGEEIAVVGYSDSINWNPGQSEMVSVLSIETLVPVSRGVSIPLADGS